MVEIECKVIDHNDCRDGNTDIGNCRIVVFVNGKFRAVLYNVAKTDVKQRIWELKHNKLLIN